MTCVDIARVGTFVWGTAAIRGTRAPSRRGRKRPPPKVAQRPSSPTAPGNERPRGPLLSVTTGLVSELVKTASRVAQLTDGDKCLPDLRRELARGQDRIHLVTTTA